MRSVADTFSGKTDRSGVKIAPLFAELLGRLAPDKTDETREVSPPTQASISRIRAGALALRQVSKTYDVDGRALPVLRNIDLIVEPGTFLTLVGPSGCGKSTVLRLIVGLDTNYGGQIQLDGQAIAAPGLDRSIVFQEHRLLPWLTVEQNIALSLEATGLPAAERKSLIAEHIALVGLRGFERAYPRQLSGGMAQRVAIARSLVTKPEILLLDEPLGALDSLTRAHLQQELLRIWRQQRVTVIMVTHDVEEAVYLSDRIVVMEPRPGRIKRVIPVDLPHARDRIAPAFGAIRQAVLSELESNRTDTGDLIDPFVREASRR